MARHTLNTFDELKEEALMILVDLRPNAMEYMAL